MSRSAGPGSPLVFRCHVEARERDWRTGRLPRPHDKVRTGRTKPRPIPSHSAMGMRSIDQAHEYRCSCGHVGWSTHHEVLFCPVVPA